MRICYFWTKNGKPTVLSNYILNSSEEFSNKTQSIVFTKTLEELLYYDDNKQFVQKDDNYQINVIGGNQDYTGLAIVGVKINNTNNLYNFWAEVTG
ncbi:hypothetical protein [Spiroplasma sp. AdecLV25b]|uniref:hypothetical protein n=1 Tax=Spiroplasma sp. AdecLV25b TaxID=3027162 RepID=UPI0027E02469|nr:hypothetical protein [Spiroplasma sp. AdecLV25b]